MKKYLIVLFLLFSSVIFLFYLSNVSAGGVKGCRYCHWEKNKGWVRNEEKEERRGGGGGGAAVVVTTTTTTATTTTVTAGTTDDLCKSSEIISSSNASTTILDPGGTVSVASIANTSDIVSFAWKFYNLDNLDAQNNPKPMRLVAGKDYEFVKNITITDSTATLIVNFSDLDKPDLNWPFYMPRPKHVRVDSYFKKVGATAWSKENNKCKVTFTVNSVDPTPTPNPACVCAAAGTCVTACFFDKYPAAANLTYTDPIKCSVGNDLFKTVPTATDKTNWCRYYLRTRGDANGDGKVNRIDYFYFVSAKHGGKLPASVNIDFNGDGFISQDDRKIIMKTLKP